MIKKYYNNIASEKGISRTISRIIFHYKKNTYIKKESKGNGGEFDFAHVTYCTATNVGDTVLSQCVRRTIKTEMKMSGWKIIPIKKEVNEALINSINSCKLLIIGGGGLFLPDTNENTISGWQWAISENQLDKIKTPLCVYSVGYNYFRGQNTNKLFVESLCKLTEKSSFFGLRNMGSVNAIRDLLPNSLSEKVSFQPCTTTLIRKIYADDISAKFDTGSVAVNIAFDRSILRYDNKQDMILKQVADAVQKIEKKGYKIYYVCHCWDDDKFLPYLKEKKVRYILVDLSSQFPERVYKFYNSMDVVLGMRGHAQMIPFGLNCEIISLGTHDKMKWFLDDISALDWYIDLLEDVNHISERIVTTFQRIHEEERGITQNRLKEAQNLLWGITKRNIEKLERMIE